jgi:hypothetical protein
MAKGTVTWFSEEKGYALIRLAIPRSSLAYKDSPYG